VAVVVSPYTAIFSWDGPGDGPYELAVAADESLENIVLCERGIDKREFRAALCPGRDYWWSANGKRGNFRTPEPRILHDALAAEKFGPARPKNHFAVPFPPHITAPLPIDENMPVSPWYCVKEYSSPPPPAFDRIRHMLPCPILEGDENRPLLDAYWYAWQIAFDRWLYEPYEKGQAVANICGCRDWGEFGSTVDYDTFFIMQFVRYARGAYPYIDSYDNMYARQHENGMINKEGDNSNFEVYSSSPTMPTALAWAEWENYLVSGDKNRLGNVLLPLVKLYEWFSCYQRDVDGFYYSGQGGHGDWSICANAFQALSAKSLADIARETGRNDLSEYFTQEFENTKELINGRLWDEAGAFYSFKTPDGGFATHIRPGKTFKYARSFDVLLAKAAPADRAGRVIGQMLDPEVFMGPYGIRSLSLDSNVYVVDADHIAEAGDDNALDTAFDFQKTVWAPVMVTALHSLDHYGYTKEAADLGERYARAIAEGYMLCGDIREYSFADRIGMEGHHNFVGWSGYGPIACLIEYVLGFKTNAPENTVCWDIRQTCRHGLEKLCFGDITAGFVCEAHPGHGEKRRISVTSDGSFTLVVRNGGDTATFEVAPGVSEYLC